MSRRTMSNWMMLASKHYFEPLFERMKDHLLKEEYIHCDETTIQVKGEEGRKDTTKSYMWVYSSMMESEHPVRLFDYTPSTASFLSGFTGILITDDYAGYNQVDHDQRALCWTRTRRYFLDALEGLKEAAEGSIAYRMSIPPTGVHSVRWKSPLNPLRKSISLEN
ncbi:transposase [uncultured Dubosiella sp.]|uniref:IS66 family transposase n=1 Tax=uncultured Dubosiella sp. TaxID=1937011 RepID=UPI0025B3B702|nr:transposase [uncultured Dubosiella sp.]